MEEAPNEEKPAISVTDSSGVTSPMSGTGEDGARKEAGQQQQQPGDEIVPAPALAESIGDVSTSRRSSFYQLEGRSRSRSVGERQWTRVRAVMTWYTRLRRIKKSPSSGARGTLATGDASPSSSAVSSSTAATSSATGRPAHDPSSLPDGRSRSSQRWMKLRTTVQLTGAISNTVAIAQSKKTSLKREDSFIARFSTRQIAEAQETFDATDEGGSSSGGGPYAPGAAAPNGDGNKAGPGGGGPSGGVVTVSKRRRRQKPPRSVLNPDENGLFYWLAFLALWVLYNLWTVVVRLAFPELHSGDSLAGWNVCDALGDAAYVLDIAVQFRTGYLEQGIMVHDSRKLAKHYVHSSAFLIDMLSLLPLDWFLLPTQVSTRNAVLARWRPALRFFRLFKLYRVFAFYYVVESRTVYPNAWRVVNLVHILLMLAHWFGCFYFLLSESEGFQSDWSYPYPEGDFATLTRKYLGSLYWSTLTLTTIGDLPTPETNAERAKKSRPGRPATPSAAPPGHAWPGATCPNVSRSWSALDTCQKYDGHGDGLQALPRRGFKSRILHHSTNQGYIFTIASYLIGVFIFATIVGQVGNVITNRNASRLEFERLLDTAKLYMRHHKVPRSMQRRVQRWYDYSWSRGRIQGGGDSSSALRILPDKLKTELALHVNLATLKKVSIFKECQPEFLHDLVLKMRASIFTPGDMICRRGEVAREMFIIADGILEVISEAGKVLTTMKAGDFFGEIGILNLDGLNKRTADVRSVGYAELFSLSREDVLAAMKDYPEAEEILLSLGRKRLVEARKAASQHKANMARKGLLALERQAQMRAQQDEGAATPASVEGCSVGQSAAAKLTDRLRSDVYGLKKAIRKSFKDSRRPKSDSPTRIEMGTYGSSGTIGGTLSKAQSVPLRTSNAMTASSSTSASSSKSHLLRRMAHVASEDNQAQSSGSTEDCHVTQPLLPQKPESPVEVIGAGLPLFQRLKLLRQRELERERLQQEKEKEEQQKQQQQEHQHQQPTVEKQDNPAVVPLAEPLPSQPPPASAEIINEKSPPPSEKQVRHISFFEELPSRKESRDYATSIDQQHKAKSARWTLAALPGRGVNSKFNKTKWLDTIAGSGSSAVDSVDNSGEPPPPPPPLPPTPPFWKQQLEKRKSSQLVERSRPPSPPPMPPPPRPPLPHFSGLTRRKKPPRRAFTLRTQSSTPESDVPYRPVGSIRSMIKPPWHRSSEATHHQLAPGPPAKFRSANSAASAGIFAPARRFSRQNTIQVVSDVQGVLTDILRDIIPHSKHVAANKPLIDPPSDVSQLDYGTMNKPNWPSASVDELPRTPPRPKEPPVMAMPPVAAAAARPKRLNLRQCKNSSSRDYNSIDDLSPEYTVLPFVKRLKILNERQKIVELQRALTATSSSAMAPPEAGAEDEASGCSGGSTVPSGKADVNETPERICLKKLLKSASRKESLEPQDQTQRMKLLRSQTVEGYAIRHSAFTKLNFQRMKNNHRIAESPVNRQPDAPVAEVPDQEEDVNPFKSSTAMPYVKRTSPDGAKEECVSELLTAIKTVLQDRLDEIQMRFEAQINILQCELEEKNELIGRLQRQLEATGNVTSPPVVIQSASDPEDVANSDDSSDEDGGTVRYFARSRSRGSFIHMPVAPDAGSSSLLLCQPPDDGRRHSRLSIDDLLDTTGDDDAPQGAVLNPEPLWQLEFGSCWQRMHAETPLAGTSPVRHVVLDLGASSDTETSASSSAGSTSTLALSVLQQQQQQHSKPESPDVPYFPDWEVQMLAESMDESSPEADAYDEVYSSGRATTTASTTRRPYLRSSASVDPQTKSSFKARQMIENWHWSYPPPNHEGVDEEDEKPAPE